MKSKRIYCLMALLIGLTFASQAQIGIGTTNVHSSARLQIDATDKGFLPPRVNLTGTGDVTTIASPATGLFVYNTATAGTSPSNVTPGFYYYDGSRWQRIINQQPDATISFNQNTPTTGGVVFTPNIQNSTDYIYVSSTNNSQWTYNGSTYVTYTPPSSTPWMLSGGTTDAGSNKSDAVYRTGSVGLGATTTPNASAQLDVNSTTRGFLPPRMTSTQRDAISSPAAGLMVYNSTDNRLDVRQNTTWRSLATLDGTETLTNKTLTTPTIASGSSQWANSLTINPTTHGTSMRASIWIDGWSLLQDINGNGTKNFAIGQTIAGPNYPTRLLINTNGDIGIGNTAPNARLDIRTSPTSTTDPGAGLLGIGTATTTAANTAGAGAIRYSTTSGGTLEYSNGSAWNTIQSNVTKSLVSGYLNPVTYSNSFFGDLAATEVIDVNNDFASSTFTAPRTGNYTFTITLSSDNTNGANALGVWEVQVTPSSGNKMVSRFMVPASVASGYIATVTGAYTVQLTAGTTVKFQIYNSLGFSKTIAGQDYNRFSIVEN